MRIEIGTDITSLQRIGKALQRYGLSFLKRFLLANEIFMVYKHSDTLLQNLIIIVKELIQNYSMC